MSLASDIARTFDVLGWMAPALIPMKVLFQKLWELKLGWDEEVPAELSEQHQLWKNQLPLLQDKAFQHCYFRSDSGKRSVELHGFSDAWEIAYSAVVYLRATYMEGPPTVVLVAAKTKVAPLKRLTIPKLELCGAHMVPSIAREKCENVRDPITHKCLKSPGATIHVHYCFILVGW